jgi:hypothetical protein
MALVANLVTLLSSALGAGYADDRGLEHSRWKRSDAMLGNSSRIMHRGRTWGWATYPSRRAGHGSLGTGSRPATLDDAAIAVCFLVLVAVVVFGGLLMLFSWVTAGVPPTVPTTCPGMDACVASLAAEDDPAAWVEVPRVDEPTP